ncbi:MAG: cyclophilin-like fold protein [Candidatus Bipolaricaulia bacterium]
MGEKITITVDGKIFEGKLNETETAQVIEETLPFEAKPSFWGEEIYFSIPVGIEENEEPTEKVEVGDIAYWPDGTSFCIFYGPTPGSEDSEPRPASPVTVVGKLTGEVSLLRDLDPESIERVRVEKG